MPTSSVRGLSRAGIVLFIVLTGTLASAEKPADRAPLSKEQRATAKKCEVLRTSPICTNSVEACVAAANELAAGAPDQLETYWGCIAGQGKTLQKTSRACVAVETRMVKLSDKYHADFEKAERERADALNECAKEKCYDEVVSAGLKCLEKCLDGGSVTDRTVSCSDACVAAKEAHTQRCAKQKCAKEAAAHKAVADDAAEVSTLAKDPCVNEFRATCMNAVAVVNDCRPSSSTAALAPAAVPPVAPADTQAAPTASAQEPSPYPTAAPVEQCIPDCPVGFMCAAGQCVSRCNPPCGDGTMCWQDGSCIPNEPDGSPDQLRKQEESQRMRAASRQLPRFTLYGMTGISAMYNLDLTGIGSSVDIGYRQNCTSKFGVHLRLGAGFHVIQPAEQNDTGGLSQEEQEETTSVMGDVFGEVTPYLGPWGRWYFGPMLWYSHFGFEKDQIQTNGDVYLLQDDWHWGAGLNMGILLLSREQLDINWRLKSAFNEQLPFRLEVGVGFHIM